MRLDQNPPILVENSDGDDVNGANRRGGIGERGFALGELEPEIVNILGVGLDTP